MMIDESVLNSIILLDKCILKTVELVNELEDFEYEKIMDSNVIQRINVVLEQIYEERNAQNYRSAIRKCIFLQKYIQKEMRSLYEG